MRYSSVACFFFFKCQIFLKSVNSVDNFSDTSIYPGIIIGSGLNSGVCVLIWHLSMNQMGKKSKDAFNMKELEYRRAEGDVNIRPEDLLLILSQNHTLTWNFPPFGTVNLQKKQSLPPQSDHDNYTSASITLMSNYDALLMSAKEIVLFV